MPNELNLEEDQVKQLETAIGDAGEQAAAVVSKIRDSYMGVVGSGWQGGAANKALQKQEELSDTWRNLKGILVGLQEGVSGSKKLQMDADADDEGSLANVEAFQAPDGGGMAGNFSRL